MTDNDVTLGEIARAVRRIEGNLRELREAVAPIGALGVRMSNIEEDVVHLSAKVDSIETRSAAIAGGISVIAFLAKYILPGVK